MLALTLLTTGGTIDGADLESGSCREVSAAADWLLKQPDLQVSYVSICNKDSREISEVDRQLILAAVKKSDYPVMITHGTFTIAETGSWLKSRLIPKVPVLLVGAWISFEHPNSDALPQMSFALERLRSGVTPGVWIAMDNQLWDPDCTKKIQTSDGRFELKTVAPVIL